MAANETEALVEAGAATSGHTAEAAGQAAEAVGMPQLDLTTFPNQIFWLLVTLVAIYLILTRVALPRIESVLAERVGTITNDLAAAEELKQQAVEAEQAYEQALLDARAEANRIVAEARAEIQADVDKASARADAEIAAKAVESEQAIAEIRKGAIKAIETVARDAAGEIVSTMGATADAKSVNAAVTARLKG